jgi:hypothetical protein
MNKENVNRLKKYLFLISLFFVIILWWHIWYVYLYNDATKTPIEWWSVSEWIIWDFPHLNPLLPSSDYNKNIVHMLYRSLIKYDFNEKSFVSDLASCDIKNLWYIECYLKENIKWSNWTDITTKDIVATFNVIKNSDINPLINSLLKETTIEEKDGVIIFTNKVKDVNFLNVLLQPIVSKDTLDNIWNKELTWKFNPMDSIFSWKYRVENISYDDSLWIQKLILTKNENYSNNDILISKYIYKFFKDNSHFLKHKDTVNIFYDQNKIIWDSLLRLDKKSFYLNQYVWVFLNQDRIWNEDLRNFLLNKIDNKNIIKNLWSWYKEVTNPYLIDSIDINKEIKNSNLESIIKTLGYYKKEELASVLVNEKKEAEASSKKVIKTNDDLKIIQSPINKKYNFLWTDDILLKWVINDSNVSEVYINSYKLASFKKWDKEFFYRVKESFNNLSPWENKYVIEFNTNWTKKQVEELYITYSKDVDKLKKLQDNFTKENTPEVIQKSPTENTDITNKIKSLEDKYYYNRNLERFSLRFYYLDNQKEFGEVANIIKNNLDAYWIYSEIIPISIQELNSKIIKWEKDYDMIIIGIDLWYFDFNIFPYFHSSQAKWWYNFSNKKDLNLDILLEELKSNILDKEKTKELEQKVLEILKEKQIVKTIYSKENMLLVDKNIENFSVNNRLESTLWINESLFKSYVNSSKKIIFKEKWFFDFFRFIKSIFKDEWELKK